MRRVLAVVFLVYALVVTGSEGVAAQACVEAPTGLVSWWPGDTNAGDVVGANPGTLSGGAVASAEGVVGRALNFDGVDDHVSVADNPSLAFGTGDFSVAFWVRFNDLVNGSNGLIHKDNYAGGSTYQGWHFNICNGCPGGGGVGFSTRRIVGGAGPEANARYATSNFAVGTWYHIVGVRQANTLRLYVDGVLRQTAVEPVPIDVTNAIALRIGSLSPAAPQFFGGSMDEIQIFGRALSTAEVQAVFNAGSDGLCRETPPCVEEASDLLAWWPGDVDGEDLSGSHDGTLLDGATGGVGALVEGSLRFDGVNDRMVVAHDPAFDFGTGDFTVSFWVLFRDLISGSNGILHKDNYAGAGSPVNGWLFNICDGCGGGGVNGVGGPGVGFETRSLNGAGAGPWTHARTPTSGFRAGVWYHVAGVRQANVLSLYVDGVLRAQTAEPTPINVSTTVALGFGSLSLAAPQYFNGQIDEAQIYARALSVAEIGGIYGAGGAGVCKPPDGSDEPPSISCPADILVTCGTAGGAVVDFTVSATDNSDPNPSIVSAPPSGSTFPAGTTTVTATATDFDGNASSCTFTVTVALDTDPPSISPPAAITRATGEGATSCSVVIGDEELGAPVAADACSDVTVTRSGVPAGNVFAVGTTTITHTATDAAGNSDSAVQTVTVVDDTPPLVTAPPAISVIGAATLQGCGVTLDSAALGAATASDNCPGVVVVVSGVPADNFFAVGSTEITHTATDASGNTAVAMQTVTVSEPPGSVVGVVEASCPEPRTPLLGVRVDAFDSLGTLVETSLTDENGAYEIESLASGMSYTISVVTPLGYQALSEESRAAVSCGGAVAIDFALTCLPIAFNPRSTGYWKHQVGVATGGRGSAQVDGPTLCSYLDLVEAHFNSNAMNPVVVYVAPPSGLCADKLEVAKALLNLKGSVAMVVRARQQFMALLLNVAAGYVSLSEIVSADGATLSQAITFCDLLIDNPSGDHELAKSIADLINNGQQVGAGAIPLSTDDIAYKTAAGSLEFGLGENRPNPLAGHTMLSFALARASAVRLIVYDVSGRAIRTLLDGVLAAGSHEVAWDGADASGARVSAGVYFCRMEARPEGDGAIRTFERKLTVVR